ncbi:hypothetical protein CMUS01_15371 [Colletotrichum musicola]|uniref:Uncharacterized protein n=1 Tax=Colletotrichum musicola TaxID=2175873 RepID=A0A8H6IX57_9PEZI|nr:hypothetical protein CMUS01_15371 [Colletotrichum musicola]
MHDQPAVQASLTCSFQVAFASSVRTTQGLPPHNWYLSSRAETAHRARRSQFQAAAEEGRVESTYRSFHPALLGVAASRNCPLGDVVMWEGAPPAWQRAIQARLLLLKAADGRASPSLAPPDFAWARLNVPRACDKPLPSASTSTQHQESSPVGAITAGHALVALGFPRHPLPLPLPLPLRKPFALFDHSTRVLPLRHPPKPSSRLLSPPLSVSTSSRRHRLPSSQSFLARSRRQTPPFAPSPSVYWHRV